MWYFAKILDEKIRKRNNQQFCERCGLLYDIYEDECPRCTGISDQKLEIVLKQRKGYRVGLGKLMYLAIAVLMIVIFYIKYHILNHVTK
ncbi:MAG: hypothetical protein ABW139_21065 [Candidatus Thiodiazotropha sp. DIVDIV]